MYFLDYANGNITIDEAISTSVTGIIVVMIILAILAVLVLLLSKAVRAVEGKSKSQAQTAEAAPVSKGSALPTAQSAGKLDLVNVDDKTAAVIMAIVSNESGIPLNRLQFNSIKKIEE